MYIHGSRIELSYKKNKIGKNQSPKGERATKMRTKKICAHYFVLCLQMYSMLLLLFVIDLDGEST